MNIMREKPGEPAQATNGGVTGAQADLYWGSMLPAPPDGWQTDSGHVYFELYEGTDKVKEHHVHITQI